MGGKLTPVNNLTFVEAIIKGNAKHRVICPFSRFNHILLETNQWKNYSWPKHTGMGFAIEATDKPFGEKVEKEFIYGSKMKVLIYYVRKDIGTPNIMHLFEHQFRRDGKSTIQLINAKTGKQILTVEGLHEADEIILKVVGRIRSFELTDRDGGVFEKGTRIYASDSSAIGLLERGDGGLLYNGRHDVGAYDNVGCCLGVLYEGAAKAGTGAKAPRVVEKKAPKHITIASPDKLKEMIAHAKNEVHDNLGDGPGSTYTRAFIAKIESLMK